VSEFLKISKIVFILITLTITNGVYAQEPIKSASEYDYPPFSIVNKNGKADGFSVELLRASLNAVDLDVEFYVGPWAKIKQDLAKGKIQVLPLVGRTPEREKIYDFSVPYKTSYGAVFVRKGETSINTVKDLADKEVLAMKGDGSEEFLIRENVSKQIVTTDSLEEAFKILSQGKHDAIVAQQIVGMQLIGKLGIANVIHKSRINNYKQDWTFAVKDGDKQLLASLNDGLSIVISNGTFDRIHAKWFETSIFNKKMIPQKKEKFSYGKKAVKQKAEDVARQVEIYLNAYPEKTLKDLQNDPEFQKIAIQPVGKTGFTASSDYNNLIILFHPNKDLIGLNIANLSKNYPVMWELVKQARGGNDVAGVYEFLDLDGVVKDKYLYIKIPSVKTADGVGMWVAATTFLDEYDQVNIDEKEKERFQQIPLIWVWGVLILFVLVFFILDKRKIIKVEKNILLFFFATALLLIVGLFIFNAYNISNNLKKTAITTYFDTLKATASTKHLSIEQHLTHIRNAFKIFRSRVSISNNDLNEIVDLGEDFVEVFITDYNGLITHSSNHSNIGFSRLGDPYFDNATEGVYIKPLYHSKTIGIVSFTISAPYKEGVLVARMNLNHIHEIISKNDGLGETGESLLAYRNENGDAVFFTQRRFTTDSEARDIIPKEDVNIPITQALLGNEKEFSDYVDYRGVPVFAVTKFIEYLDAGLVVKIDHKEALKPVLGNIKRIWYSTTIVILSIVIIGIIFYLLLTYSLRNEVKNKTYALEKASEGLSEQIVLLQHSEKNLIESEVKVKASLKEKEVLLRELYHRTKNNMQVIVSMISLQSNNIKDKNSVIIFNETTNKINSMALVHEKLYQTKDLSRLDLKDYFTDLFSLLKDSYQEMSERVILKTDMEQIMVTIDTAIPCGLIMNELISNIFKHAFPGDQSGNIQISLKMVHDDIEIIVRDNGIGFPSGLDYRNTNTLGIRTVIALAEQQLLGSFEYVRDSGTQFKVIFKDQQQVRI